jgi:TonB-linked SusC/RagA family outer membrane protein
MKKRILSLKTIVKLMKISFYQFLITVLCSSFALAHDVSAQKSLARKVNISAAQVSLRDLLNGIEKQTDVKFVYSSKINTNQTVVTTLKNPTVLAVLTEVLRPLGIDYEVFDNRILLKKLKNQAFKEPESVQVTTVQKPERRISGTVKDIKGEPLIGVSVSVKNTNRASISNMDGKYTIDVPDGEAVLIFSYLGFKKKEVPVINTTALDVVLEEDNTDLDEIIVVGYGTEKRSDLTGAVSKVDLDKATAIPTTNVAEMLRGQAAGVQVTLGSARPGGSSNILIRGQKSLSGGNDPLIVMDGFPIDNINDINPDDIASIEILKDASAQAIYGARASNGVILVTTKRGKEGKMQVGIHTYFTSQRLTKNFDMFSPEEFAQYRREAVRANNPGGIDYSPDEVNFGGSTSAPEYINYKAGNFADWEKTMMRTAVSNSNTINISGGNEVTKVFSSLNYFTQTGLLPNSDYKRGAFRLNLNRKISSKVDIDVNLNMATDGQQRESSSLDFITISPFMGPYDVDGNLTFRLAGANASSSTINPLWNIREANNQSKSSYYNLNVAGNYAITKTLSYRLNALYNRKFVEDGTYRTRLHSEGIASNGSASLTNSSWEEFLIENILNYSPVINDDHKLDFTFVHSVNQRDFTSNYITGTQFSNDILGYDGITNALNFRVVRSEASRGLIGFLGRARYNLLDKYLFTFTARQDGSSVFAKNNKWGFFPAGSFAWKIHNESFMENLDNVSELKLRLSYGSVGNQALSPYQTLGLVNNNSYVFGGILQGGNLPGGQLPNPNLTWETGTTLNAGLDFGFLKNRIVGTLEYYDLKTRNLLTDIPLGGTSGFSSMITNGGEIQNRGIEALLTAHILRDGPVKWSVTGSFTRNRNKLLKSGIVDEFGNPKDDISRNRFIGHGASVHYTKIFDGIFQTDEEAKSSAQGSKGGTIANPFQSDATLHAGAVKVKDVNGDGVIDINDNVIINAAPDWFGSFSTNVSYKGFELMADVYTVQGITKYNPYLGQFNEGGYNTSVRNGIKRDYWTPENPSNTYPRPNYSTKAANVELLGFTDASYIRLRTLSLAYSLPQYLARKAGLNHVKLYVTGTNLWTITDYKSYSPENNPNEFPDAKGFTTGLNLSF